MFEDDPILILILIFGVTILAFLVGASAEAHKRVGVAGVLAVLSVIPIVVGFLMLSRAAMGVGLVAAGCYLAIVARILQAERHHKRQAGSAPDADS